MKVLLSKQPYTFDRVFRMAFSIASLIAFVWLMRYLSDVLIPFFVAFILAYLLNPLVTWVQKTVKNRLAALILTMLGLLILCSAVIAITIPIVTKQVADASRVISTVMADSEIAERAKAIFTPAVWEEIQQYITDSGALETLKKQDLLQMIQPIAKKVLPGVWGIFSGAATLLASILSLSVILLYLALMLMDFNRVKKEGKELIPPPYRKGVLNFLSDFNDAMNRYFRNQAIISLLTGIVFAIGFTLIGLPMAIPLGLFIGLLCMIPYLQLLGMIPAGLLAVMHALDTSSSIGAMLGLTALVFIAAQIVQDGILTPKFMGKMTGLSPALLLLSLSIWAELLGFLGLILAIPLTCLMLAWYKRMLRVS